MESITTPSQLTPKAVTAVDPQWIFVPHWSHWIPESIWGPWATLIFHMTDRPYVRGSSPLHNLIQRGHSSTMITALRCGPGLDKSDVYLKQPLSRHGSAEEIFLRSDILIEQMMERIVLEEPTATPQQSEPVVFSRRRPLPRNLASCPEGDLSTWYEQIRHVCQRNDGLHANVRSMSIASPPRWLRRPGDGHRHDSPQRCKSRRAIERPTDLAGRS